MMKLYYFPGNASFTPHVLLLETGADFELVLVDRNVNAHKSAEYLELNPSGRIPALVDGDLVLFETAAICLHIADKYPETRLAPAVGTTERSEFHKWLFYMATTIQPEILLYYYGDRHTVNNEGTAAVKAAAEARLGDMLALVDKAVADGPYLMGQDYMLLDPYLLMLCRWCRNFEHPPGSYGNLGPYLEHLSDRPTIADTFTSEGIDAPYV